MANKLEEAAKELQRSFIMTGPQSEASLGAFVTLMRVFMDEAKDSILKGIQEQK